MRKRQHSSTVWRKKSSVFLIVAFFFVIAAVASPALEWVNTKMATNTPIGTVELFFSYLGEKRYDDAGQLYVEPRVGTVLQSSLPQAGMLLEKAHTLAQDSEYAVVVIDVKAGSHKHEGAFYLKAMDSGWRILPAPEGTDKARLEKLLQ